MTYTAANQEVPTQVSFPTGLDMHWETENRVMWNEQERQTEEQELIYEISWICELGVWRRFLKSRRTLQKLKSPLEQSLRQLSSSLRSIG